MMRMRAWMAAAALAAAGAAAQSPQTELDPEPTRGLGGGPGADPREHATLARVVVEAEIARLRESNPAARQTACERLGQLGGNAHEAIDALVETLADPFFGASDAAASALAAILRRDDAAVIVRLETLVASFPQRGARGALKALSLMRLRRESTAALMTEFVEHDDVDARLLAMQGLVRMPGAGPRSMRTLAQVLADGAEPDDVRVAAGETLRRFGADVGPVLQDVVRALPHPRAGVAAARVLHDAGGAAAPWKRFVATLYEARAHDLASFDHQFELARALDASATRRTVATGFLRRMLASPDAELRDEAAWRAGRDHGKSLALLPDLIAALKRDPAPRVRARAAAALGLLGETRSETIAALLDALRDPAARFDAATSLGLLAPDLEDTVSIFASDEGVSDEEKAAFLFAGARVQSNGFRTARRLAAVLDSPDPFARGAALAYLGCLRFAPPEADAALARLLTDPNYELRETARWTLARCHSLGLRGRAVQSLRGVDLVRQLPYWLAASTWWSVTPNDWEMMSALGDYRHRVRHGPSRLRPPGPPSRAVARNLPEVVGAARDGDARVREQAALVAAGLGRAAAPAAIHLAALLDDPSRRVRLAAVRALAAVGTPEKCASPIIAKRLSDPCWSVRRAAVETLRALKDADPSVSDALTRVTHDPVASVRDAALLALADRSK